MHAKLSFSCIAPDSLDIFQPQSKTILILYRRQLVIATEPSPAVVKHLNVIDYVDSGVVPGCVDIPPDAFVLEQLKEIFCDCIVVTDAAMVHVCL